MAWIEAHQSLGEHPKLKKAARLLGVPRPQLVGHLFYLWWWALDYAPDGDVSRYDAEELADAAKWEGDAEAFVGALTACRIGECEGFLERTPDGRLAIHDWWEYAGKLVQRRQSDAERKRRERSSGRPGPVRTVPPLPSADVRRTSDGHPADVRTHTTQPTEQTQPTPPTPLRGVAPDAAGAAPDAPLAVPVEGAGAVATSEPDRSRPRDPLWDAFQVVWPQGPRTETERGRWNKAAQEMRAGGVTSDEILLAAKHWPNVMGAVTMTPMGLASNLSLLLEGPQVNGRSNGTVQEHRQRVTQTAIAPVSSRQLIEQKRAQRALAKREDPRDAPRDAP